jgi:hypothetical protein
MTSPVGQGPGLRFRFMLKPLREVTPWGESERYLHWFGLTEGWYWIELGNHELLRCYSAQTLEGQRDGTFQHHPYVDYYVARYWEDLIQLAPVVMQPVPGDLAEFIASHPDGWAPADSEESWEAAVWHGEHVLDLSYLRQPPHIRAWRTFTGDVDEVTLTWRHLSGAIQFAADSDGCVRMSTESFVTAVRQLDHEFMIAMRERISELEQSRPPSGVSVDMDELRYEQLTRATWLAQRFDSEPGTNWEAVRVGAGQLLRQ